MRTYRALFVLLATLFIGLPSTKLPKRLNVNSLLGLLQCTYADVTEHPVTDESDKPALVARFVYYALDKNRPELLLHVEPGAHPRLYVRKKGTSTIECFVFDIPTHQGPIEKSTLVAHVP